MINFDTAAYIFTVIHYLIALTITCLVIFSGPKKPINFALRFYIAFFIWGLICYLVGGCPITLFENWVSERVYGKPFYPDYTFTNTDFYYIVTHSNFYIPLVFGLLFTYINKRYEDVPSTNSSSLTATAKEPTEVK